MNSITLTRPFSALRALLIALVLGALMAAGLAATPAHAVDDAAHLTVNLTTKAGKAPSSTLNVFAQHLDDGNPESTIAAVPVPGKAGSYLLDLEAGVDYVLVFDYPALVGAISVPLPLYYGGTSNPADAKVLNYAAGNWSLDANVVSAAKIAGKVVGSDKKPLKAVEVTLLRFDGTSWQPAALAFTSAKGTYSFPNVDAGSYKISYVLVSDDTGWVDVPTFPAYFGSKYVQAFSGNAETLATASVLTVGQTGTLTQNATLALGGSITGKLSTNGCSCDGATVAGLNVIAYRLLGNPVSGFTGVDRTRGVLVDSLTLGGLGFGPGYPGRPTTANGSFAIAGLPAGYYVVEIVDPNFDGEDFGHPEQYVGGSSDWRTGTKFVVKAGKVTKAPTTTLAWATSLSRTDALINVTDVDGVPIKDIQVKIESLGGSTFTLWATTRQGIPAKFTRIVPGLYKLTVENDGYLPLVTEIKVPQLGVMTSVELADRVDLEFTDGVAINGDPVIGTTLTAEAESTLDALVDVTRVYQWYRDGVPIFGAQDASYKVRGIDLGSTISVRVYLDAVTYGTRIDSATLSGPIAIGQAPTATTAPVLSSAGGTLRVNAGRWDVAAVTPSYTWLVGGTPISNAGVTYKLTAADAGKSISVNVVASKFGYADSAPTSSNVVNVPKLAAKVKTAAKITSSTNGDTITYTLTPPVMSQPGYTFTPVWRFDGSEEGLSNTFYVSVDETRSVYLDLVGINPRYVDFSQQIVVEKGAAPVAVDQPFITVGPDFGAVLHSEGIAAVGVELRADESQWLYSAAAETPATRAYQWLANGVAIKGATKSSFTPTVVQAGSALSVAISVTNPRFEPASFTFGAGTVANDTTLHDHPATVALTGTGVAGSTLTAKASAWSIKGVTTTYEWYLCQAACLDDETTPELIAGATGSTLVVPSSAPLGSKIAVVIRGLKTGYDDGFAVSSPVTVREPELVKLTATLAPKPVKSGSTFTVTPGAYSVAGGTTSIEWFADQSSVATGDSFTPSQPGAAVRAVVTYELAGYVSAVTTLAVQQGPLPTMGTPAIGSREFGGALTIANPFTYSGGPDALATLSYQWLSGGKSIKGATKATLPATEALLGKQISVRVVSKSPLYPTATFTSATTTITLKPAPETTQPVTFSVAGGLKPGAKATLSPVTWDVAGLKVAYQWQSSADGATWANIAKATKPSYTATASDAGKQLRVRVSATKAGYWFAEIGSASQAVAYSSPLEFTTDPTVAGSGAVGTTLKVSAGTTNTPGAKLAYQWLLDDVILPGATKASISLLPSYFGKELSVRVTASKSGNLPVTVEPRGVKVGVGAAPVATSKNAPKITGTLTSGSTLTASTGIWNIDGLTFTYQWKRNGVDVADATSRSYELTSADVSAKLTVVVTATRTGYATGIATSAASKAIK